MSDHPAPYRLEALAVGELDAEAEAHLEGCPACRKYIDDLLADRSAMLDEVPAAMFLAQPEIAAALERTSTDAKSTPWTWLRWLLPLACVGAAAAIFLLGVPRSEGPMEPDEILYKGGPLSVEIIRQRTQDGTPQQSRHTQTVPVRSGDALRVRLRLAKRTQLTVAVIADGEGDWMTLADAHWFDEGSHFVPGDAMSIEAGPTTGHLLIGSPDAIAAAQRGVAGAAVIRVRIEAEVGP